MTTTYQPLPIADTDLAQIQGLLADLPVTVTRKQTAGGEDYILLETIATPPATNTTKLAAIRKGVEADAPPRWLLQHPNPRGLWEFKSAQDLSNFLHFANRNQYLRCFLNGGSQLGAIVGDEIPANPLMLT